MILSISRDTYAFIILITCALITFLLRASSFLLFKNKKMPKSLRYLGYTLPLIMMPILVVYGVSNVEWVKFDQSFAAICGILSTALIHLWRKNTIISLVVGTSIYMLLLYIC